MKGRYLFFISGDLPELAKEEIFGLFNNLKLDNEDEQIVVASGEISVNKLKRLALTHEVCEYLGTDSLSNLYTLFKNIEPKEEPVCVRVRKIGKRTVRSSELERKLGEILWRKGIKISVSKPSEIIKVYVSNRCFIGRLLFRVNKKQFIERRPDKNPFFRPYVMLPKIARALINITGVNENELLLDPMCGIGTFLIEAGLMNINTIGLDYFEKIVKGCSTNLKHYNLPANLVIGDARRLPLKDNCVDAIVTDYPYLRSSKCVGNLDELYNLSIPEFKRVLKNGKKIVIVSDRDVDDIIKRFLKIKKKIYQRIHKNLVRRIFICIKYN